MTEKLPHVPIACGFLASHFLLGSHKLTSGGIVMIAVESVQKL